MVEGASLESLYTGNCIEGSNPSVSANALTPDSLRLSGVLFLPHLAYELDQSDKYGENKFSGT